MSTDTAHRGATAPIGVLVFVHDPRVRTSIEHLLDSTPGVAPLAEHDGREPDVVLVDLTPTPGGHVVRKPREAGATPLVALGFDDGDRATAAALGVERFVLKTAPAEELLGALRAAAAGSRAGARGGLARAGALVGAMFLGPWAVWLSRVAEAHGLLDRHLPQGVALWSITPVLLTALFLVSGRAGLADLGRRLVRWRVPAWTWLAAIGSPVAIACLTAGMVRAAGGTVPVGYMLSLRAALGYLVYGTGLFLLTEEAGWRGVLLPRAQRHLRPTAAALLVGTLWAGWHLPLLAVPGEGDYGLPLLPFVVLTVATSVLITALVNAAGGSVLVAALFHAAFDASYAYVGVVGDHHAMLWVASVVTAAAAALLVVLTRGRLLLAEQARP
ncbi:MAG: CPBP family intramembrane glutamic endopeptidase [Nocardioidaceae bacterium]